MKKFMITSCVAALGLFGALAAQAETTICNAPAAAGAGTAPTGTTPGTNFMAAPINPKCSANVYLVGEDGTNGAFYSVGSTSAKGKNTFKASTNGGGVAQHVACAKPGACTLAEAQAARTQAATDAAASSGT